MSQYNKLIVALIGVAVMLLKDQVGLDLSALEPTLVDAVIGVLTAIGVFAVPNKPRVSHAEEEGIYDAR